MIFRNTPVQNIKANLTPEEQERVIVKFAKRKKVQFILMIPALICIALAIVFHSLKDFTLGPVTNTGFVYIFLGIVVLIILYTRFNWRCPACSIYMGPLGSPKECRRCGARLRADKPGMDTTNTSNFK